MEFNAVKSLNLTHDVIKGALLPQNNILKPYPLDFSQQTIQNWAEVLEDSNAKKNPGDTFSYDKVSYGMNYDNTTVDANTAPTLTLESQPNIEFVQKVTQFTNFFKRLIKIRAG
jgi:hypothetical protein